MLFSTYAFFRPAPVAKCIKSRPLWTYFTYFCLKCKYLRHALLKWKKRRNEIVRATLFSLRHSIYTTARSEQSIYAWMRAYRMNVYKSYTAVHIYKVRMLIRAGKKKKIVYLLKFVAYLCGWTQFGNMLYYQIIREVTQFQFGAKKKTVQFAEVFISILCTYVYIHTSALQ